MDKKLVVIIAVAAILAVLLAIGLGVGLGVNWGNNSDSPGNTLPASEGKGTAKIVNNDAPTKIQDKWIVFMTEDASLDEVEQDLNSVNMPWTVGAKHQNLKILNMGCPESVLGQAIAMPTMKKYALYVEPDTVVNASEIWGLDRIDQRNLPLSNTNFQPTATGAGVNVYVLDTGIRATHTQFTGRVGNGFTAVNDGQGTNDCNGHGTHVSGTIAGTNYGVAKQATLHPVRVLGCDGSGSNSGVISGIDWVTANKVLPAVASMSLGGGASTTLDQAIQRSINAGVPYVVAAGNENADACGTSPARVPAAITVGASTITDQRASFSNFGTCVDIFAPGLNILSSWITSDTATNTISGTSMATPHVSGAVALFLQGKNPVPTPAQVAASLTSGSTNNVLSGTGTGSPNKLLYWPFTTSNAQTSSGTTTTTTTTTTGPATCTGVCKTNTGNLGGNGAIAYHPDGNWYQSTTSGVHSATLTGPPTSDFDLVLYKYVSGTWARVAASEGATSSESINYNGNPGFYVWRVNSFLGTGAYTITMNYPK